MLALAFGTLSVPNHEQHHPTLQTILLIAFGVALLVAAAYLRRRQRTPRRTGPPNPRAEAFRRRLSSLRPVTALATGAVLGIGGPKRLGITIVATASITAAGLGRVDTTGLAVLYVLVATILVWVPVLLYVVFGHRAADWLTNTQAWIVEHKDPLTFYPSAIVGVVLIVDGLVQLTT